MKDAKTITIKEIMEHNDSSKQENVTKFEGTFDRCVNMTGCKDIDWRNFLVYEVSSKYVLDMIFGCVPEFLLAVCDLVKTKNTADRTIKILIDKAEKTEITSVMYNGDTMLVCIYLSEKDAKNIANAAKNSSN